MLCKGVLITAPAKQAGLDRGERKPEMPIGEGQVYCAKELSQCPQFAGGNANKPATCVSSARKDVISVVLKTLPVNGNFVLF